MIESDRTVTAGDTSTGGRFVISLDFELYWGVLDAHWADRYDQAILGAHKAIPSMLELFQRYDIQATWAAVGLLFLDNANNIDAHLPDIRPRYRNVSLDSYRVLDQVGRKIEKRDLFFAKDLISEISRSRGQEIGTHTFSHYYCWDDGNDEMAFRADLAAAIDTAAALGIELKSIVFPRNQVKKAYLPICSQHGIVSYRERPASRLFRQSKSSCVSRLNRAGRVASSFIGLGGSHLQQPSQMDGEPVSIIGSRFLHANAVRSPFLRKLHLDRIKAEMTKAAQHNGLFHLWWHPHNFGMDTERKLDFLGEILDFYQKLKSTHGMTSLNMLQVAEAFLAEKGQASSLSSIAS